MITEKELELLENHADWLADDCDKNTLHNQIANALWNLIECYKRMIDDGK